MEVKKVAEPPASKEERGKFEVVEVSTGLVD